MRHLGIHLMVWSGQVGSAELALLPKIKAIGYDGVELPLFEANSLDIATIKSTLADNGLVCTTSTALPPNLSLIDTDRQQESIQWLSRIIENAAGLGASILCGPMAIPVGALRGRGYTQAEWELAVDSFQAVDKVAGDCGITLALEPLNRFETFMINTIADGVRLVDAIDSPNVGLLLDTFHMHIEEKSTPDAIRHAAHHIKHFHCSENDRGAVGSGQIRWSEIFSTLEEIGYGGWLVVESFNAVIPELAGATCIWRPVADSPEALARDSIEYIQANL